MSTQSFLQRRDLDALVRATTDMETALRRLLAHAPTDLRAALGILADLTATAQAKAAEAAAPKKKAVTG